MSTPPSDKTPSPGAVTQCYVVFSPSFFEGDDDVPLPVPDRAADTLRPYPKGALSFWFFDRTEVRHGEETLWGEPRNMSGIHYIGGVVFTPETLPDTPGLEILRANIEANGWKRVIRCRLGWQPFEDGDVVVAPDEVTP